MKDYRQLAFRYIKKNLRRSIFTIIGVAISTIMVFTVFNLGMNFVPSVKEDARTVFTLSVIFVSYILSIISIGIVGNSLQLYMMEQVKDFGALRCMGATEKQIEKCLFTIGLVLDLSGIVVGVVLGALIEIAVAKNLGVSADLHIFTVGYILLVFLSDLYFVIRENRKLLKKLTPVDAVRGKYNFKKEKIKKYRKSFLGKIFGIEVDYAVKNLQRNSKRFWQTMISMGVGIAAILVGITFNSLYTNYVVGDLNHYGSYQVSAYDTYFYEKSKSSVNEETGQNLMNKEGIEDVIKAYGAMAFTKEEVKWSPELLSQTGLDKDQHNEMKLEELAPDEACQEIMSNRVVDLRAYEDLQKDILNTKLEEGTMDVSEKGIIWVRNTYLENAYGFSVNDYRADVSITDYKLGDKITLVNYKDFCDYLENTFGESYSDVVEEDFETRAEIISQTYNYVLAKGGITEYTIEGIVSQDAVNVVKTAAPTFIMPLKEFHKVTNTSEEEFCGYLIKVNGTNLEAVFESILAFMRETKEQYTMPMIDTDYLVTLMEVDGVARGLWMLLGFVLYLVFLNILNILNSTSANMHLRRKEFAQLRVLGMSKKSLLQTIFVEGLLTCFWAGVLGLVIGYFGSIGIRDLINTIFYIEYSFRWDIYALALVGSVIIYCGFTYLIVRHMKVGMAEELRNSNE